MKLVGLTLALGATALLSACGDGTSAGSATAAPQATGNAAAAPAGETAAPAATGTPAAPRAAGDAATYTDYVGKYAHDEVNGATLMARPEVIAAVRAALGDDALYRKISTTPGPSTPIYSRGGKIGSWACEQHNCGDHQWAVLFDPATKSAEVCYRDAATTGQGSKWYSGGRATARNGDCPSE